VTDNPIIFSEDKTISGGHFHGQPIALPIDYAGLAASELGNIADRRIYLSMMENVPGLPKLLMEHTGLNSGFMILQYSTAALASENKTLCFPASADSIPTSLGQEDHVSMGRSFAVAFFLRKRHRRIPLLPHARNSIMPNVLAVNTLRKRLVSPGIC
jgi:histidine ammonia-lyase